MLHLHIAWNLEELADRYLEVTSPLEQQLFRKRLVVTPNMMIGRWLQMQVAKFSSISVNLQPVLAASYTWRLMKEAFPDLTEESLFSADMLHFTILGLLEDSQFTQAFPRLDSYLKVCRKSDLMVLSGKLARIFDHYQVYRSDWLESWEQGKLLDLGEDEAWQQAIWLEIIKQVSSNQSSDYSKKYRSQLEHELLEAIKAKQFELPESVFIFGVSNLPTSFINLLKVLADYTEVYVFAFCSMQSNEQGDALPFSVKHWHRTGLEFLQQFPEAPNAIKSNKEVGSQLEQLKVCLVDDKAQQNIAEIDGSIYFVNSFSEMREVEALYDFLLNQFAEHPNLKSDDILVAVSDLEKYAPYIRAVFDVHVEEKKSTSHIPYVVNGNLSSAESPLINGLLDLLEIPLWRFTREQVMVLARNRLIQKHFSFDDDALDQIDVWLDEAGVRWGIDEAHKESQSLPNSNLNTWRAGLDRMLLGSVLPKAVKSDVPLYKNVLPVDDIEGSLSSVLTQFVRYCENLFHWREVLLNEHALSDWQLILQEMLKDFFAVDEREENTHLQLLELFDSLKKESSQLGFENLINAQAVSALLEERMSSTERSGRFAGVVNFTSMNNLAGIPFQSVCLLGMNYDAWPSQQREPAFDLLHNTSNKELNRRIGDRDRASEERYLTLQLILSAQSVLYVSYVGRDMQSGAEKPPSVLVSELKDFCELKSIRYNSHNHAMHPYSASSYLSGENQNSVLKSHSEAWLKVAQKIGQGDKEIEPLFPINQQVVDSNEIEQIEFEALIRFFQNPQSSFLRNHLSVYIKDDTNEWNNSEPFNLSNFADSRIRQIALNQTLHGQAETSGAMARASAQLPHGVFGELLQEMEQHNVDVLVESVDESYPDFFNQTFSDVPFDITIGAVNMTGVLSRLCPSGQITVISDAIYPYRKVQLWLQHLVLCCVKPEGVGLITRMIGLDSTLTFHEVEAPETLLKEWIDAFANGHEAPLPFFAKTSMAYAEDFLKKEDPESALKTAEGKWKDNDFSKSKGDELKPANQFLYRGHSPLNEKFCELAETLLVPLLAAEGE